MDEGWWKLNTLVVTSPSMNLCTNYDRNWTLFSRPERKVDESLRISLAVITSTLNSLSMKFQEDKNRFCEQHVGIMLQKYIVFFSVVELSCEAILTLSDEAADRQMAESVIAKTLRVIREACDTSMPRVSHRETRVTAYW